MQYDIALIAHNDGLITCTSWGAWGTTTCQEYFDDWKAHNDAHIVIDLRRADCSAICRAARNFSLTNPFGPQGWIAAFCTVAGVSVTRNNTESWVAS
jgi:hypothetical protein